MGNYLNMADQRRILALLELGWSYRRIERETGVRRETVARYDPNQAAKADNPSLGSGSKPAKVSTGPRSAAEPYREFIKAAVGQGLSAQRIWQDLQLDYGFGHAYASVKRLVRQIKREHPEVADVMEHPPGQEAQVDYFQGPPTFRSETGKWQRPWIFRMTLSCSRHSYEEPLWGQDRTHFLRAHEHAFRSFGGVPTTIRHDNLKAAVVRYCLYDPDIMSCTPLLPATGGSCPCPVDPIILRSRASPSGEAAMSRTTA